MYHEPHQPTPLLVAAARPIAGRIDSGVFVPEVSDLVCVTLYNEPLDVLESTLASLIRSAALAHRDGRLNELCICLVADGAEREDTAVSAWLDALSPWQVNCELPKTQALQARPWLPARKWSSEAHWNWTVNLIVHRKPNNRGKLHSHAVFFTDICPRLRPARCWQIDVGTIVEDDAMSEMIDVFSADPHVGAVGSRVELSMPDADCTFVQRWQYMDFALQAASLWPAEAATSHMSVVPGQFCAVRWEAMSRGGASAPVHQYLRGLQPSSRMDQIMFLAEDRVIGNELVLSEGEPWRLAYGHQAGAITDACATFPELLRQRRRWHNSSFACRLWLLASWPSEMVRSDRSFTHKLSFSVAMLWQLLLATVQCLTPSLAVAVAISIGGALIVHAQSGGLALSLTASAVIGLAAWAALRPLHGAGRWRHLLRDALGTAALVLYGWVLYRLGGWALAGWVLGPMLCMAALPIVVLPGKRARALRFIGEYWLLHSVCQMVLWIYAMRHLGDTSWGTKGLVSAANGAGLGVSAKPGRYERAVLGISILANSGVLALCTLPGMSGLPAGTVVAASSGVVLVMLLVAVAGHIRLAWARGARKRREAIEDVSIHSEFEEQEACAR